MGWVIRELLQPEEDTPNGLSRYSFYLSCFFFLFSSEFTIVEVGHPSRTNVYLSNSEKLPKVKALRPSRQSEGKVLSKFQLELIQLASQLNGDHALNTYPDIGKGMTVAQANRYTGDAAARFLEAGRAALMAGANDSAVVTMRSALTSRTCGYYSSSSAQSC